MSNNFTFWGKRFGFTSPTRGNILTVRSYPNGVSNSGKKKMTSATRQSIHDKKKHADMVAAGKIPYVLVTWKQYEHL